jgi:hypothetical protein
MMAVVLIAACRSGGSTAGDGAAPPGHDGPRADAPPIDAPAADRPPATEVGQDGHADAGDARGDAGDAAADARGDAGDGGPEAGTGPRCGAKTCAASEYCIQECFCGGAQLCTPAGDGGQCPSGTCEMPGGGMGCRQACDNPPPRCTVSLTSCAGAPPMPPTDRIITCACPP